jgi:magnesium-transporting ATPase (P-type)
MNNNPISDSDSDNEIECRMCLEGKDETKGRLFKPCLCKGTQGLIHEKCLKDWRMHAINSSQYFQCPTCKYKYNVGRPRLATVLMNPITITLCTILTIVIAVILMAFLIRFFMFAFIGIQLSRSAFALSGKIIWWSVLVIGFLTLLCSLFSQDEGANINGLDIFVRIGFDTPELVTYTGYGFSLVGFGMFIKMVYFTVEQFMKEQLDRIGERVLEVQ